MSTLALICLLAILAWTTLLLIWGRFWRADQRLTRAARATPPAGDWPEIVAVIPARDEAAQIGEALEAHAASDYPGVFSIILVDDGSTDGTGEIARAVAGRSPRPIRVIAAPALETGWTGKLWAVRAGLAEAARIAPEARFTLLTDADIRHAPGALRALVAKALAERPDADADADAEAPLAMVSLMARLDARGFWGGLLIPAFIFFFQKLYPFPLVNAARFPLGGAAGGCMLIRTQALAEIGGVEAIRAALIDDCALAAKLKLGPPRRPIWLGLSTGEVVSLRDNRDLGSVWKMVARTAYAQLGRSPLLLIGCVLGMVFTYLAGPLALLLYPLHGDALAAGLGALAWALSALAYLPTLRLYEKPAPAALALPIAAALYTAMTVDSAFRHHAGRGGAWKGRTYSDIASS